MPAVKKGKSKKVDISKMSEAQAWSVVKDDVINPMDTFEKAGCAAGCRSQQCIAVLSAIAASFVRELEYKSAFFLPGFGTFQKKVTPAQPGKMIQVWGKWRAQAPKPAKAEIIFVPFGQITEYLLSAESKHLPPGAPSTPPGAASSSSAAGSAGPKPAEHHSPAPRVIVSADKDDDDDSVMGSFSDDGNDPPPAPALSGSD